MIRKGQTNGLNSHISFPELLYAYFNQDEASVISFPVYLRRSYRSFSAMCISEVRPAVFLFNPERSNLPSLKYILHAK